jgi:hypothetical protein
VTVIDLHEAYQAGSREAASVFSRAATGLGRGLAIIADTLNPERIILGGIGMRLGDALVRTREGGYLNPNLSPRPGESVRSSRRSSERASATSPPSVPRTTRALSWSGETLNYQRQPENPMRALSLPLEHPAPDAREFVDILAGKSASHRVPLIEYIVDDVVMKPIVERMLGRQWVTPGKDRDSRRASLDNFIQFWYRMGYDFVRYEESLPLPEKSSLGLIRHLCPGRHLWRRRRHHRPEIDCGRTSITGR